MKSSILHLLSLALILSFSAACGKKSDGGSSSNQNANGYINPVGGSASGDAAYNNLKAWYDRADDTQVGIHGIYLKDIPSSFPKSMCLKDTIVVDCINPTGCFKSTTEGVKQGVVEMTYIDIIFGITSKKYSDCNISNSSVYTKSSNLELSKAVLGTTGKFLIKSLTRQSNSIFTVYFGNFSGSITPTSYAVVNASLPSIVNPTESGPINNGNQVMILRDYRIVQ